ncbi:hypothetical protein [Rathayibacter caricis]|uniref:hypothetical protein n=1 Tax=Rathayibacter caricis TaxID=110936 RepID=UPI001474B7C1|nr:hypothetical protein [Rathayibacter caricis]
MERNQNNPENSAEAQYTPERIARIKKMAELVMESSLVPPEAEYFSDYRDALLPA